MQSVRQRCRCSNRVFLLLPQAEQVFCTTIPKWKAIPVSKVFVSLACATVALLNDSVASAGQSDLSQETAYRCLAKLGLSSRNLDVYFGYACLAL